MANAKALVLLMLVALVTIQISSVQGVCYQYVCRRRCIYRRPTYEEYAFRWFWPRLCGWWNVRFRGAKACCRTWGTY